MCFDSKSSPSVTFYLVVSIILGSFMAELAFAKADTKSEVNTISVSENSDRLEDAEQVPKSRMKRSAFPKGSRIKMETILTIPVPAVSTNAMTMDNIMFFDLPSTTATGRSYQDPKSDRFHVYARMEEFLNDLGYNGHACTLRTLCEIAETPFEHGLYGEILNLILSASVKPEDNGVYDEYMTAEYYGKNYGNCAGIYTSCPNSVLDIISNAF